MMLPSSQVSTKTVTVIVMIAVVIAGALATVFLTRDHRQALSLNQVVSSAAQGDGDAASILGDLTDHTDELCAETHGCIEAYSSSRVQLLRFDTEGDAAKFAADAPGSHRSDWIVVVYGPSPLSGEEKTSVADYVDSLWTSD